MASQYQSVAYQSVAPVSRPQSSSTNPYAQNYRPYSFVPGTPNPAQVSANQWSTAPATPQPQQSFQDMNTARQDLNGMTQTQWDADQTYIRDQENRLRGEIGSGWDSYLGSLGGIEGNLGTQRTAQENIANSQYTQGVNTVESQKAKSLRDIGSNIRNAFQAGNIYLGARGAGDSSATNQYSFAVQQEGAKQTGNLNEYVNTQIQTLASQKDQQVQQIAAWFADAQNQLKQQIATGQLNKSRDIQALTTNLLNQAMQAKAQVEQNAQSQYNGLVQWAANNSQNVGQLQQNIASIPQGIGMPTVNQNTGQYRVPVGFGSNSTEDRNSLF